MKRTALFFTMTIMLFLGGLTFVKAQEQPAPKKDTVNMDTDAKPEFYYDVEDADTNKSDSNSSIVMIASIAAGIVIIIGGVAYFLVKKKK